MMITEIKPRNLILTGVPRGGTTLTSFLLNQLENVVALDEPMNVGKFTPNDTDKNCSMIEDFFAEQRQTLILNGSAISQTVDGSPIDNPLSDKRDAITGQRIRRINSMALTVEKQLGVDFTLGLKHPAAFSAMLPVLHPRYECYAAIRNPLAILLSWQNAHSAVFEGRAPAAERVQTSLTVLLDSVDDRYNRQIALLSWYFDQYEILPIGRVLKYEDIVQTDGNIIPLHFAVEGKVSVPLSSRNTHFIENIDVKMLADKLLSYNGAYMRYYTESDILALISGAS